MIITIGYEFFYVNLYQFYRHQTNQHIDSMKRIYFLVCFLLSFFVLEAQNRNYNIVFIGNSITYGALLNNREFTAPPALCAKWLEQQGVGKVYFHNCGRSGRTTYHFLPDINDVIPAGDKTFFPDVIEKSAQIVESHPEAQLIFSIMIGTNDSAERPKNHRTDPANYAKNIITIIDSLLSRWPDAHVILQRPIYYYPEIRTKAGSILNSESLDYLNAYFKQFDWIIKQTPKGHVHVGDTKAYNYFKKHCNTDLVKEIGGDGKPFWLHPNEQGAQTLGFFWGKAIRKVIKKIKPTPVNVILTAGQSNADGRVPLSDFPDGIKYQFCYWSYGCGDFERASGEFSLFSPRSAKPKVENSWGFDAILYHLLEQEWKKPFFVIKQAVGGTAIDRSCKGSTNGLFWSADPDFLDNEKSLLRAFAEQIHLSLNHLQSYNIRALIWHQGESDKNADSRYYDNLKNVISYIRNYLVKISGNKKYYKLPVVCATFSKDSRQASPVVVEALKRIEKEDHDFHVIDATDLPLLNDRLHFNAQGAKILGNRFFEKMNQLNLLK